MKWRSVAIGIGLCAVAILSACKTMEELTKGQQGAGIGAVVGGLIGSQVTKDRRTGAIVGAAVGALGGYLIGRELDKADQEALKKRIEEAAEAVPANQPVEWKSDRSEASATITPIEEAKPAQATKKIQQAADVEVPTTAPLRFAAGTRIAMADVNVRLGPGTKYKVRNVLKKDQTVETMGMTDEGWYLIAEGGVAVGYVSGLYLRKPGDAPPTARRKPPSGPTETAPVVTGRSGEPAQRKAILSKEVDVRVVGVCRPVRVRVRNESGGVEEQILQTCQNPDGSWGA